MFRDVLDLVPQSTVKVDDVTVGKVTAIDLDGYAADVTVGAPQRRELPDNAAAEIRQTSLLGEKFVSLAPPDGPEPASSATATDRLAAPAATPRSKRSSARCPCCSTAVASAQLKTIARS